MMENNSDDDNKMIEEPLLGTRKGGFITMPFIIANEAFEKVSSYGLMPNMIVYLMQQYHMEMAPGTNILLFWSAATNFNPVLGAFVADAFVGRFCMISFGSIFIVLGMLLLWLTTIIPQIRPPPCDRNNGSDCPSPTTFQLTFFCFSLALLSIGAGGIRSSSMAFGTDQLNKLKNTGVMERYFSWYYAASLTAILIALTCVVYIQDNMGWMIGFGVPLIFMFLGALLFFLASPFYVKVKAKSKLLIGFAQVIVASYRKRHLKMPSQNKSILFHHREGSTLSMPSSKLRFLNKACIIENAEQDLTSDGETSSDPWSLCTVEQVEELKALFKVIPMWSSGVLMSVNVSQTSFTLLQAISMNRNITPSFQIPAGSFGTFTVASVILWVALYNYIILPLVSTVTRKTVQFSTKQRMGCGLFVSCMAMLVAAIVEGYRRRIATEQGDSDDPQAIVNMSAIWLVPQHCLLGVAEGLNAIAQNEFYYAEFPRSMSSIASTLFGVGLSAANLVATFIMNTVDTITRRGGNDSWISSNINKGHYDYYYLVLAGLSFVNFIYFLLCSRAYGPCVGENRVDEEG